MIYFIACRAANAVKIGSCADSAYMLYKRLSTLRCSNPWALDVIGAEGGGRSEEAALHLRFAPHRIHGDWFRLAPEIEAYAAQLTIPPYPHRRREPQSADQAA